MNFQIDHFAAGLEPVGVSRWDVLLDVDGTEWQVSLFVEEQGTSSLALYTRIDFTPEDETAVSRGEIDITALFFSAYRSIRQPLQRALGPGRVGVCIHDASRHGIIVPV